MTSLVPRPLLGGGAGTHCLHWEILRACTKNKHAQTVCTRPLLGRGGAWYTLFTLGILRACANSVYQASPREGRGLVHTVYTGNITRMCKQCVPGLSSGGEGPGDEAKVWQLDMAVTRKVVKLSITLPCKLLFCTLITTRTSCVTHHAGSLEFMAYNNPLRLLTINSMAQTTIANQSSNIQFLNSIRQCGYCINYLCLKPFGAE